MKDNIVKSNKFIKDHNFSITDDNNGEFRKFQIHNSFIKETYKNSKYIDLPNEMGLKLINFKKIVIKNEIEPRVRIIVGKKLINNTNSLRKREPEKWKKVKEESIKNSSWKWKKMTAIISIKPSFIFVMHIFDQKTGKKLEEYSGSHIDFKTAFRLFETLEISHAKHFKTATQIYEKRLAEKEKAKFDLANYVFIKILRKQFDHSFLLTRWFLEQQEFNSDNGCAGDRYQPFDNSA